jgi:hypothetical protein
MKQQLVVTALQQPLDSYQLWLSANGIDEEVALAGTESTREEGMGGAWSSTILTMSSTSSRGLQQATNTVAAACHSSAWSYCTLSTTMIRGLSFGRCSIERHQG